jgi:hypothetical protein
MLAARPEYKTCIKHAPNRVPRYGFVCGDEKHASQMKLFRAVKPACQIDAAKVSLGLRCDEA